MKKSLICISCPLGCSLDVKYDHDKIISVDGSTCKRGQLYAEKEIFNPERIVTSTVKIKNSPIGFLPVKTDRPVSKESMMKVMDEIFKIQVKSPINVGEIIKENIAGTSANLVATRNL